MKNDTPTTPFQTKKELRHDLQNELASILALAESIELKLPAEEQEKIAPYVEKIREKVQKTSRILQEVLAEE